MAEAGRPTHLCKLFQWQKTVVRVGFGIVFAALLHSPQCVLFRCALQARLLRALQMHRAFEVPRNAPGEGHQQQVRFEAGRASPHRPWRVLQGIRAELLA